MNFRELAVGVDILVKNPNQCTVSDTFSLPGSGSTIDGRLMQESLLEVQVNQLPTDPLHSLWIPGKRGTGTHLQLPPIAIGVAINKPNGTLRNFQLAFCLV